MRLIFGLLTTYLGVVHAQNTSTAAAVPSAAPAGAPTHAQLKKRGLVYVWPQASDNEFWNSDRSPLTWYYNYNALPTYGLNSEKLEFVPMLWGNRANDAGFYDAVKGLMDSGTDVKYVLGFNEPDACDGGSSCVDPGPAAKAWKQQMEPLKEHGVKLGAPAVRPGGTVWLQEFFTHCNGGCTVDFMPAHYYGDAGGIEEWVNTLRDTYRNISDIWVTEFACPDCTVLASEQTFNESVAYMDQASYISHYGYFGAFREDEANSYVGPNVAMLNNAGNLTSIGVWYLNLPARFIGRQIGSADIASFSWWHVFIALSTCILAMSFG